MSINLNFINKTGEMGQAQLVIYQKQVNPDFNRRLIAWQVIEFSGQEGSNTITYTDRLEISILDPGGIHSPRYPVSPGFLYHVTRSEPGAPHSLNYGGPATREGEIQILNSLNRGAMDICCHRSGSLLAKWHDLIPMQRAIFQFEPTLCIVIVPGGRVDAGEVLDEEILSHGVTELPLNGLKRVDLVLYEPAVGEFKINFENHVKWIGEDERADE